VDKNNIIGKGRKLPPQVLELEEAVLGAMIDKGVDDVLTFCSLMPFIKRHTNIF
jgi:replicative DNA helicase